MKKPVPAGLLALCMSALSTFAAAQPSAIGLCTASEGLGLSQRDEVRLESLVDSRTRGLAEALLSEDAQARAEVSSLFANGLAPSQDLETGDYRCRTIKLGGPVPAIAYGYFECRVEAGREPMRIDKTSGSQRFSGTLTPSGTGLAYRGALHYADEGPIDYRGDSDRDQVGCLVRAGGEPERYLLELPAPAFESVHDVIELLPIR